MNCTENFRARWSEENVRAMGQITIHITRKAIINRIHYSIIISFSSILGFDFWNASFDRSTVSIELGVRERWKQHRRKALFMTNKKIYALLRSMLKMPRLKKKKKRKIRGWIVHCGHVFCSVFLSIFWHVLQCTCSNVVSLSRCVVSTR